MASLCKRRREDDENIATWHFFYNPAAIEFNGKIKGVFSQL